MPSNAQLFSVQSDAPPPGPRVELPVSVQLLSVQEAAPRHCRISPERSSYRTVCNCRACKRLFLLHSRSLNYLSTCSWSDCSCRRPRALPGSCRSRCSRSARIMRSATFPLIVAVAVIAVNVEGATLRSGCSCSGTGICSATRDSVLPVSVQSYKVQEYAPPPKEHMAQGRSCPRACSRTRYRSTPSSGVGRVVAQRQQLIVQLYAPPPELAELAVNVQLLRVQSTPPHHHTCEPVLELPS